MSFNRENNYNRKISYQMAEYLSRYGARREALRRDWYFRLRLAMHWFGKINHYKDGFCLDNDLLDGVDQILKELMDFLDLCIDPTNTELGLQWRSGIWIDFSERLCQIIDDFPLCYKKAKAWRLLRSQDHCDDRNDQGPDNMPRSMRRLNQNIRDVLVNILEQQIPAGGGNKDETNGMFRHVYDIPWQVMLRKANQLCKQMPIRIRDIDFPFREVIPIHSIAVEFHLRDAEWMHLRLSTVIQLIKSSDVKDIKEIGAWLIGTKKFFTKEEMLRAYKVLINIDRRQLMRSSAEIISFGAENTRSLSMDTGMVTPDQKWNVLWNRVELAASILMMELSSILDRMIDENSGNPGCHHHDLCRLKWFLYSQTENDFFYKQIADSMMAASSDGREIEMWTIGRVSFGASYEQVEKSIDNKSLSVAKTLLGLLATNHASQNGCRNPYATMGRYDAILLNQWHPKSQNSDCNVKLPPLTSQTGNDESFPSFFIRRELAIKFLPPRMKADSGPDKLLAIIIVVLQKRTYRLEMLYRIINAIEGRCGKNKIVLGGETGGGEDDIFGGFINVQNDQVCITDGWGDLAIMFWESHESISNDRVESIFKIQKALFNDFMVNRTELILTPLCADTVAKMIGCGCQKFSIQVQIRLRENYQLDNYANKFIVQAYKALLNKPLGGVQLYKIFRIPGRMDYRLVFKRDNQNIAQDKFIENLWKALDMDFIDRIDTSIAIAEEDIIISP